MKKRKIKHELLNGGKETEIHYPIKDDEFDNQVEEIFVNGNYGFHLPKDGVYMDLGANVGMATLYFANFAKKIYAIEPNPDIYEALVENTKHLKNVETFNVAWANGTGKEFLYGTKLGDLPQTFWDRGSNKGTSAIVVDCITPKDFWKDNKIGHIDLLKVDIEDAEYIIFPSDNFGEITKDIDAIIGEAHFGVNGGFPEIIPELLKPWGYKTTFPKLKKHNYRRFFKYTDLLKGMTKEYLHDSDTIFLSKK